MTAAPSLMMVSADVRLSLTLLSILPFARQALLCEALHPLMASAEP